MVKVSVLCPMFRPGGVDITFSGLSRQTYKDFELIIIDRRYEKRHQAIMETANKYGVFTIHAPEHRRNGKWAVVASAWNTAFMLAQGEIALMLPDYTYAPPDWIEKHLRHHDGSPKVIISPYVFYELLPVVDKLGNHVDILPPEMSASLPDHVTEQPPDTFDEISIFEQPFNPDWIENLRRWPDNTQCLRANPSTLQRLAVHIHFRNESMPLWMILDMNGLDEHLDRGKTQIDLEFAYRIEHDGCPVSLDNENVMPILNPRTLFPTTPYRGPGRWSYQTCEQYKGGFLIAANHYSLKEKREKILIWREMRYIPTDRLDIPDDEYYKEEP